MEGLDGFQAYVRVLWDALEQATDGKETYTVGEDPAYIAQIRAFEEMSRVPFEPQAHRLHTFCTNARVMVPISMNENTAELYQPSRLTFRTRVIPVEEIAEILAELVLSLSHFLSLPLKLFLACFAFGFSCTLLFTFTLSRDDDDFFFYLGRHIA